MGPVRPRHAAQIERLGYGAVWVGGSPAAGLEFVEPILERTESLVVATGIVNVWSAPADQVAASCRRIEAAYPGRFLLGVGVGHREQNAQYRSPVQALDDYLDELDHHGVPASRRVIAALGPNLLGFAARRSVGAHPYLTTPEHTALARNRIGPPAFLAPEHKVVLTTDASEARQIGRQSLDFYLGLNNYIENWKRLGFTAVDTQKPGSDNLIDAVVAHGSADAVADRLTEHLRAGADHVAIQVLGHPEKFLQTLASLAESLGLSPRR